MLDLYFFGITDIVKPVYNSPPWDPQKVAVVLRMQLARGFSIKISNKISLANFFWPLLTGCRCSEVAVNTGSTVHCNFES